MVLDDHRSIMIVHIFDDSSSFLTAQATYTLKLSFKVNFTIKGIFLRLSTVEEEKLKIIYNLKFY